MSFCSFGDAVKLPLSALLLACAPVLAHAAAPVKATITMRDPTALEVSYAIPPTCAALEFRVGDMPHGARAPLRGDWRAADDCTALEGGRIVRKQASCTTLRLRVPASAQKVDRIYPWAYPIEQGLFAHTSVYAVKDTCGAVDWAFEAPGGTVVVDGVMSAERGTHAAGPVADYMPVVLTREPIRSMRGRRVLADARFSSQSRQLIDATLAATARQLAHDLPGIPFKVPFIVASPTSRGFNADVAHRTVMRLTFVQAFGPQQEADVHHLVAHETAHLLQPSDWHDTWDADGTTVNEGGAEFLRLATSAHLGWFDRAAVKTALEQAVNACILAADGKPWKDMPNRNWNLNPYHCGLAFYAIGLSAAGTDSPLLRLRDYDRKARLGERTDFARDIECGDAKDCAPRWLARVAGSEPLDAVLLDYARQPGALLRVTDTWSPALVRALAFRHVAQLMRADCGGAVSMFEEDAPRIAAGPTCGTLRPDMVIVRAEGLPLFENADAVKASVAACHARGKTVLGLRDGTSVTVPCGAAVALPAHAFALDEARMLALLK
jgi:hypothetical protein